jgi:hypothetical protein
MNRITGPLRQRRAAIVLALVGIGIGALWFAFGGAPLFERETFSAAWPLFLLAAVIGELLVVENPRGRPVPASLAIFAALALLGAAPWEVAGVAVAAWVLSAIILRARGDRPQLADLVHHSLLAWSLPGLAALGAEAPSFLLVGAENAEIALGSIATVMVGLLVGPALWQAIIERSGVVLVRARGLARESVWVGVAIGSSAALVAVAYPLLGLGSLLLLLLPILAVRAGLHHYVDIRRTYDQTIVAMARMTELTGHVAEGHGVRTGEIAVDVARRLGLSERDVHTVERTAHLHEVGRIATDDPENRAHDEEVAHAGAEIVREAGGMPEVAEAIQRLRDPYRKPGDHSNRTIPVAARIVRTVCEYDRLLSSGHEPWEAVDTLHRAMAYDHDPVVVTLLSAAVSPPRTPVGGRQR